jgi:hypothetical protein
MRTKLLGGFVIAAILAAGLAGPATVALGPPVAAAHPEPGDVDGDGIRDEFDNCRETRNADQSNTDRTFAGGDVLGDRCDTDADADGVTNSVPYLDRGADNCPLTPNPDQTPADADPRFGKACYVDTDTDGVADPLDNCPAVQNPGQADYDFDRTGDVCDPDNDEDGEFDTADNCPLTYNYDQADADGDGIGTACDSSETVAPPPGTVADRTAPALALGSARVARMAALGSGLAVKVRCNEACAVRAKLTAGRLKTVASGTATLAGPGTTYVFMRFKRGIARKLGRSLPIRAQLTLTAADATGNERTMTRRLQLRR